MEKKNKVKVSICSITYNQEKYIAEALESFIMQKTKFPFEILIHDDASTDSTADIIRAYEKKYPDIIKPIYQTENKWSKGINPDTYFNLPRIKGDYIAACDGDDYWTDEYKLQKQVDFLESHPDFSMCFHPVKIIYEEAIELIDIFPEIGRRFNKSVFDFDDLIQRNFIATNSVMYRWRFKGRKNFQGIIPDRIMPCDWYSHLLQAKMGEIGFIDEVMGVYRRQPDGVWYVNPNSLKEGNLDELYVKNWYEMANFFRQTLNNLIDDKEEYKKTHLKKRIKQIYDALLNYSKTDEINVLKEWFPDVIEAIVQENYELDVSFCPPLGSEPKSIDFEEG